ncbi:MAG: hypothetical protein DWI12_11460 [Planctomycetota bacterium]|nr:MAG: hypothetical protein DWI12_11460 [Planctomycetota bacterium]
MAPRKPPKNEAPPRSNQVFDSNAAAVFSTRLYAASCPREHSLHFCALPRKRVPKEEQAMN